MCVLGILLWVFHITVSFPTFMFIKTGQSVNILFISNRLLYDIVRRPYCDDFLLSYNVSRTVAWSVAMLFC